MYFEDVILVKVELLEITIVLAENADESGILKVFSEYIFRNRAIVTMESSITVVALQTCSFFETSVASVLLLLNKILQGRPNIDEHVLLFVIHDILVVLEAVLVEVDTINFFSRV